MSLTDLLEAAAAGQSQGTLAAKAGVAQTTISGWMRGAILPSRMAVPALAAALGMPAEELAALVARERKARLVGKGHRRGSCPQRAGRGRS